MKIRSHKISALAAFSIAFFIAVPCQAEDILPDYKVGDKVTKAVHIGKRWFPLEDGEYTVIGAGNRRSTQSNNFPGAGANIVSIILVKSIDKKPHSFIIAEGNTEGIAHTRVNGWTYSKECERKDVHFVQKYLNVEGGEQNCYIINHYTTIINSKDNVVDSPYRQALAFANSKNVDIPANFVGVHYRFADFSDFVNIQYRFNPEYEGFPRSSDSSWAGSNWHRDRIGADPRRVEYINKIVEWAKNWHPKVEAGFSKKWKPEISSVPSGDPLRKPHQLGSSEPQMPVDAMSQSDSDAGQRLKKLKKLLDEGLIEKGDYDAQKKRTLDSM
jgi:hypothetical protein